MPDESRETAIALGRLAAGQEHMNARIGEVVEQQRRHGDATQAIADAMREGFAVVNERVTELRTAFDGHTVEDERRFNEAQRDIDRAHRKIGSVTAYPAGEENASGTIDTATARKAGWLIGILSGLGALGTWVAKHFGEG